MDEFVFLDTETTGNDLLKDRLFQVCYKHDGQLHSEYFKPPLAITIKSQSITHVTDEMVADKPAFFDSPMKKELNELLQNKILVAHNAVFDIAMLTHEEVSVPKFICTLKLVHALDPKGIIPEYNLQYLRYYLKLNIAAGAHEAADDVLVLEALFQRLYDKMMEQHKDHEMVVSEMMRLSQEPFLFSKFTFGKHKGKIVSEIAQSDPSYMQWLLEQKLQNMSDGDEDWIYTLKHYLKES